MVATHKWLFVGALTSTVGCVSARLPAPGGPVQAVRAPEAARVAARSTDDAVAAAEIAWVAGNDRAYATARLDDILRATPDRPEVLLRRGILALSNLDMANAGHFLTRTIAAGMGTAEAGAALVTLHGWATELAAQSSTLGRDLAATGLTDVKEPADPFHRALATALLIQLGGSSASDRALARTGGWLSKARIIGPLGPQHDRILTEAYPLEDAVDWRRRPAFRGTVPPVRTVKVSGHTLEVSSGGRRGTYIVQAFFRLADDHDSLIQVRLPGSGRVKIDGFTVIERDADGRRPPGLMARRVRLDRGWHRLTMLVAAGGGDTVSLSMLDDDGRPITDDERTTPPAVPLVASSPTVNESGVAAFRRGHPYWLASPRGQSAERALFARLLAAASALSRWLDDLESGRAYLFGLEKAAPKSAAVWATRARLVSWSRLPGNLVQAHLREALDRDPTHVGLLVGLGRRNVAQDPAKALELAEQAIAIAPRTFAGHALASDVFQERNWHAEAIAAMERAAALGAPPRVLFDGARYLRSAGQVAAADRMETLAIARSGGSDTLAAQRAARQGDLARAIELLGPEPLGRRDRFRKAEWALALGQHDIAMQTARAILEEDPLISRAQRIIAVASAALGDVDAAREAMAQLRLAGQTSPRQEALAETFGGPRLEGPEAKTWLGQQMAFDPVPLVAPLPGSRQPRGLDASDRWAGHGQVQLLDRLIDRVQSNGAAIALRHNVLRLQTKEATDRAGEIKLPANALTLSLRTLKPDGTSVDVDRHPGKSDLSFSALAPGDAVEQKWVAIERPATPWGGYLRRFFFQSTSPVVRSELAVIVPRGQKVEYFSYNGAPQPIVRDVDNETIYLWKAEDVTPVVPEPQGSHPTEYVPFVVVAVDVDRETALRTRSLRLRRLTRSSYDIERAASSIAARAKTPEEQLGAIFGWVVDKIEHGNTSEPTQVLTQGRGNRTGLLAAMLRSQGIQAEVVRARTGRAPVVAPSYPDLTDFSNTLVRVTLPNERVVWADMDRESPWLGRLSPWYQGGHYLTRTTEGRSVIRPMLEKDTASWPIESALNLRVRDNGDATGTLKLRLTGLTGVDLARLLASARPEDQQRQLQRWLATVLPSAQLQHLQVEPRSSSLAPLELTATVAVPGFMATDRGHLVSESFFSAPLAGGFLGQPGLRTYLRLPRRETPLLLAPAFETSTIVVSFPRTVAKPVETPRTFNRTAEFGRIEQRFEWDDERKQARLVRRRLMPLRRISPSGFPAFRDNAQTVLQASQNRLIVPVAASQAAAR